MNKHNTLSVLIIGLLFTLLFTPAIVADNLFFPYITGKAFAFRTIITVIIILWTILVIKNKNFLPSKSVILGSGLTLIIWMAISNIFGVDPLESFFSNFERMEGWFTHTYLFAFLVIISSVFKSEKIWNWFFGISTVVAQYVAFAGLQGGKERIDAVLGNSTYVAIYMLFNIFFAVLLLYRLYNSHIKDSLIRYSGYVYYVYSIILFLYIILRTQTRGTILAIIGSVTLFSLLTLISYWKHKAVRIASLIVLLIVILGSILFWQNKDAQFIKSNPILDRITTISASEGSGRSRILTWNIGLQGIAERPLLGWGQENYSYVFAQKYNPEMHDKEPWFDRTHNAFLDWAVHNGIPALILYLFFILACIYAVYISTALTRVEKNLLYSIILGYCIHNIFVFDSYSSYLLFFSVVGFIIFHSKKDRLEIAWNESIQKIIALVVIITVLIFSYNTIIKPRIIAADLLQTLTADKIDIVVNIYQSILTQDSLGKYEATIRYLMLAPSIVQIDNEEFVNEYIVKATEVANSMMVQKGDDVRFLEVFGMFLMRVGNFDKAIEILVKARELAPNKQNNLYTLGMVYIQKQEYVKALEVFKHAYDIFPSNIKAQQYYGAVLLLNNDKRGIEYIEGYSYKDPFFISVFMKTKQYQEVVKIREQIIKDSPKDYQAHISLAVAYVLNNQRAKAIETIKFVQKEVSEFKAQGDVLIKEIQDGKLIGV